MTTGRHCVRDLYCVGCDLLLGWRYEFAQERREKYKVGWSTQGWPRAGWEQLPVPLPAPSARRGRQVPAALLGLVGTHTPIQG